MTFRSSRTLPGQPYRSSAWRAACDSVGGVPYLAEAERSSFAARGSMSSGRSRSGGTVHSNTFSL